MKPESTREQGTNAVYAALKGLADSSPEIFGRRLHMVQNSLRLAEKELAAEGRLSEDALTVLSETYEEYRPKSESETQAEIDQAIAWVKSELGADEDMPEDRVQNILSVLRKTLEVVLTGEKKRIPMHIAEEVLKDYRGY